MQAAVVSALYEDNSAPRPFLKWVGGKRQLIPELESLLPTHFGRYHEPFIGGGALFFHTRPTQATISDANEELADCYRAVRDCPEELIRELRRHTYEKDYYYAMRAWDTSAEPLYRRAGRTIYLNRTGFNGLYRVNRAGQFNVPFGRYDNPLICDEHNLRTCSSLLRGVEIGHRDFSAVLSAAKAGDFVYFDPPYVPVSPTASFTAYVSGGFGAEEHARLAEVFRELAGRGVNVMLSNSDTPLVRQLFRDFHLHEVRARRAINSNAGRRGDVGELIVRSDYIPRGGLRMPATASRRSARSAQP